MTTPEDCLQVELRDGVRRLRLNRPQSLNALNRELVDALATQVQVAEEDASTAVVVVSGNGPSFCAGGDFREFLRLEDQGHNPVVFLRDVMDCFGQIAASTKPWVAALHGHVVAGGLELALACDVVIAADTAMIGDGHLNNQLLPAGGSSVRLPKAVGLGLAQWLLLSGELLPAQRFVDAGWILRTVPERDLESAAEDLSSRLVSRSGAAQEALKAHLHHIADMESDQALREELDVFARNWTTGVPAATLRDFLNTRSLRKDVS